MVETTNYSGRLHDLFIMQGAKLRGEQQVELGFGTGGQITTGIQKLAQTFTVLFLTEVGSVPAMLTRGTRFVTAVRQGRIIDESSLQSEFALAVEELRQILDLEAEATNPPDDEAFASATLVNFEFNTAKSKLALYIRITSVAGTSHDLYVPLSVALR